MKFGKYEIVAELGQGAMGKVYRAMDPMLDRQVALKTVSPALLTGKDTLARFRREARAAAKLQHPNIVTIYELGEQDGTLFIAMELVEGEELAEILASGDRYTVEQKVRMMVEVCRGLEFAHKMGVIHRDVKPANILVARDGSVKLLDFGIGKMKGDADLTQTGMVLGTPSYISPELLQGAKVDHKADMWAVGVILYEVLSGRRPFEAKTIATLIHKIIHEPLAPLDARELSLPEPLVAVVARALDRDPGRRFVDLGEMARALLDAIGATPPPETPLEPVVRKRGYELNFAEARRLLADDDLSGALEAARRAQSLEPNRTGIVAVIKVIEERLGAQTTVRRSPKARGEPGSPTSPTRTVTASPTPSGGLPMVLGPLDSATLRARGAGALADQGAFGEPPATKEVALSPVADVLALAGGDGGIRLWDLRSRTRTHVLRTPLHQRTGHDAAALALAFSPDGALLASGHLDGSVHLWDMAAGQAVPVKLRHEGAVPTLAFSPDGATLATGSQDASLRLWDVGAAIAGDARRSLVRQPAPVTALAWGPGGEWVLTGHLSRVLRMTDPLRGRLLSTFRGPAGQVSLLELSPDGRFMAVGSRDRTVRLLDLSANEERATLNLQRPGSSLCFLADGAFLAIVSGDNAVQLWDLEAKKPAAALWGPTGESFVGLALYGEWNHLAVALSDGRIRVWGPAT